MMKKKAIISALCVCLGSGFIGAVAWAGSISQEAACTVASGKSILLCADVQDVVKGMGKKEEKKEEAKEEEALLAKEEKAEAAGEQAAEAPKQAATERPSASQAQAEAAPKAPSGGGASGGGVQPAPEPAPAPEPVPEPPAHTHSYDIPVYGTEQVYVVDQAAWTETVSEPVYDMVERSICNGCGADITGNPWGHIENQMLAGNTSCGGYHSDWQQVQVGTNTYTVPHPEQGHYEEHSVVTGYQCSCGAAQ